MCPLAALVRSEARPQLLVLAGLKHDNAHYNILIRIYLVTYLLTYLLGYVALPGWSHVMPPSLCSAVMVVILLMAMLLAASSLSLSNFSHTNALDHPDLSVHNILPSYRTEGKL